jgi:Fe-S oxidoreductase
MEKLEKELETVEEELIKCMNCGICRAYCPVFEYKGRESWNPRGRLFLIKGLRDNKISFSKEVLDRIYSCSLCKTCDEMCPPLVKFSDIMKRLRVYMAQTGLGPLEGHKEMSDAILKSGNVFGKKTPLLDVIPSVKDLPDQAPNLLFAGCVMSSSYPNIAEAMIKILKKVGYDFTVIKDGEDCCAAFLDLVGLKSDSGEAIEKNLTKLRDMKIKNVVAMCPFCYGAFKELAEETKAPFSAQHSTQLLLNLVKEGKIKFERRLDAVVTYFDPCHLGRYQKVYETPRSLLKSIPGVKLVEMDKSKKTSRCCGGTIRVPYIDIRTGMSDAIVKSAKEAGAEYLVTACSTCYHNLRILAFEYDLRVCNIEELVAYCMGVIEELPE